MTDRKQISNEISQFTYNTSEELGRLALLIKNMHGSVFDIHGNYLKNKTIDDALKMLQNLSKLSNQIKQVGHELGSETSIWIFQRKSSL